RLQSGCSVLSRVKLDPPMLTNDLNDAVARFLGVLFNLQHLHVHNKPVPKRVQGVKYQTFSTLHESALKKVSVGKVGAGPHEQRYVAVNSFLCPALSLGRVSPKVRDAVNRPQIISADQVFKRFSR